MSKTEVKYDRKPTYLQLEYKEERKDRKNRAEKTFGIP